MEINVERPKTLFMDIDGTLIKHHGGLTEQHMNDTELLPGVLEKFREWDMKGYRIILTTGRKESHRRATEEQLLKTGIFWDQLVMGVTGGDRILVNDRKPNSKRDTAYAFNIDRNAGLGEVDLCTLKI